MSGWSSHLSSSTSWRQQENRVYSSSPRARSGAAAQHPAADAPSQAEAAGLVNERRSAKDRRIYVSEPQRGARHAAARGTICSAERGGRASEGSGAKGTLSRRRSGHGIAGMTGVSSIAGMRACEQRLYSGSSWADGLGRLNAPSHCDEPNAAAARRRIVDLYPGVC